MKTMIGRNHVDIPKVRLEKTAPNQLTITIEDGEIDSLCDIMYQSKSNDFPLVTIKVIGELYKDDVPMAPIRRYAPWHGQWRTYAEGDIETTYDDI